MLKEERSLLLKSSKVHHSLLGMMTLAFAAGCATPVHTGYRGIFDDLARRSEEGTSVTARQAIRQDRTPAFRGPAAREVMKSTLTHWTWPLKKVRVTSKYGERGRSFHEGIDLQAKNGTPAFAVNDGKVLFAGSKVRGYGRVIVIKHPDTGLMTVYAHLSKPLVKYGDWVKKGQKIALTGSTGRVSGPHLHFEIRKGVTAYDPLKVLKSKI